MIVSLHSFQTLLTFVLSVNMDFPTLFRYVFYKFHVLLLAFVKTLAKDILIAFTMRTKGKAKIRTNDSKTASSNDLQSVNNADACVPIGLRVHETSTPATSHQQQDICVAPHLNIKLGDTYGTT